MKIRVELNKNVSESFKRSKKVLKELSIMIMLTTVCCVLPYTIMKEKEANVQESSEEETVRQKISLILDEWLETAIQDEYGNYITSKVSKEDWEIIQWWFLREEELGIDEDTFHIDEKHFIWPRTNRTLECRVDGNILYNYFNIDGPTGEILPVDNCTYVLEETESGTKLAQYHLGQVTYKELGFEADTILGDCESSIFLTGKNTIGVVRLEKSDSREGIMKMGESTIVVDDYKTKGWIFTDFDKKTYENGDQELVLVNRLTYISNQNRLILVDIHSFEKSLIAINVTDYDVKDADDGQKRIRLFRD